MATYVLVLVLGVVSVLLVGQVLLRTGRAILEEAFGGRRVANSVNQLLSVLFHLGALGVLALISTVEVPVTGETQTVVTKLGLILVILGVAHGLIVLLLTRLRARSRERETLDKMNAWFDAARRSAAVGPAAQPVVGPGPSQQR
ncbi:MAG TPA: hypothetical protein VHH34_05155 [Pseudonocardiaceae bacterium]|nr:hypothetical protein [Pseudonocardiaceae bacterium]